MATSIVSKDPRCIIVKAFGNQFYTGAEIDGCRGEQHFQPISVTGSESNTGLSAPTYLAVACSRPNFELPLLAEVHSDPEPLGGLFLSLHSMQEMHASEMGARSNTARPT
jgi:hypothetical protein